MRLTLARTLVLSLATLASCEGSPVSARPFALTFLVESDPGIRLAHALVSVDGSPVGVSSSGGVVRTVIRGSSGQRFSVEHDCPAGYRAGGQPKALRLRTFEGFNGSEPGAMEITLRCQPTTRIAAFVVRASNGPDLPVLLDGEVVTRTNGAGVAHFSTRGAAGTDYALTLDTQAHPQLRPERPARLFTLADADEIFVFTQAFEVRPEPRRRHRPRPRITKIE